MLTVLILYIVASVAACALPTFGIFASHGAGSIKHDRTDLFSLGVVTR